MLTSVAEQTQLAATERLLKRNLDPTDGIRHYVRDIDVVAKRLNVNTFPWMLLEQAVAVLTKLEVFW